VNVADRKQVIREFLARPPFMKRNVPDDVLDLFLSALTHDSYSNECNVSESYERLEFLGDAVIELIICEHIYRTTNDPEGNMTIMKQDIVANRKMSSKILEKGLDIDNVLSVGNGHIDKGTKTNVLEENMRADAFEALIGAAYLTYGMEEAKRIVFEILL